MRAAALNFRDIQVARGTYTHAADQPIVPLSDGSGVVVEAGAQVDRFAIGDRVITSFFPDWIHGSISREKTLATYGAKSDVTLATELVLPQEALVHAPKSLTDSEAATLTCAGVTAWNALACSEAPSLAPGGLRETTQHQARGRPGVQVL
jgi:NADPH:quinone reductase-like Zn-dependent oxidoreductase